MTFKISTFKISADEYLFWAQNNWFPIEKFATRDVNNNRYGQKFIKDHYEKGFIHTDPELFYEESPLECAFIICKKYIDFQR